MSAGSDVQGTGSRDLSEDGGTREDRERQPGATDAAGAEDAAQAGPAGAADPGHEAGHRGEAGGTGRSPLVSLIGFPVVVLVFVIIIRSLVVQTFVIPSGSMEDTLVGGDRVVVTMYDADDIERGDVIVFHDPGGWLDVTDPTGLRGALQDLLVAVRILPEDPGHHLIKRVIGVAGDHVVADGSGSVSVNGVVLEEDYVKEGRVSSEVAFDVVVPEGYVWVMGDNRANSSDSRFHQDDAHGGFVPVSEVVGVAKAVVWPLGRIGLLSGGDEVFATVPRP